MNSKDRGLAPFRGKSMDRFPMWYGADVKTTQNVMKCLGAKTEKEALYDILGIDFMTIRPAYKGKPFKTFPDGTSENEWGIQRGGYYWGQALNHPMSEVNSFAEVDAYRYPDPDDWEVKISAKQLAKTEGYCLIGGTWAPFFHDSLELVGMEEFMLMMYIDPALADRIIGRCFDFYHEVNERTFKANPGVIDLYFMGNDFGSQKGLLVSPEMWRKFYGQRLRKIADLAHSAGAYTALHSCGDIHEIIPDLINAGIDAINPVQVFAANMDPVKLEKEYGADIIFFGGIDENVILRTALPEEVRLETRRIIDILGRRGRYIVAPSHDYLLPEIPAQNIIAMYDEAKKYGTGKL